MDQQRKPHQILLADDDEDDREIFRMAVHETSLPVEVTYTENGEQLLKQLDKKIPDVIFLDLNMPMINGFECLKQIRSKPALQQLPVVILSTSASKIDIDRCFELGSTYYIVKPFEYIKLGKIIQQLFEKNLPDASRATRQNFVIKPE